MLGREDILSADDLKSRPVLVPDWGGEYTLREMTGVLRDAWVAACQKNADDEGTVSVRDLKALLLIFCLVDDEGELLFCVDDLPALQAKSGRVIDDLFRDAQELNGLDMSEEAVQEAAGN